MPHEFRAFDLGRDVFVIDVPHDAGALRRSTSRWPDRHSGS